MALSHGEGAPLQWISVNLTRNPKQKVHVKNVENFSVGKLC
jgi:hypothetical protein